MSPELNSQETSTGKGADAWRFVFNNLDAGTSRQSLPGFRGTFTAKEQTQHRSTVILHFEQNKYSGSGPALESNYLGAPGIGRSIQGIPRIAWPILRDPLLTDLIRKLIQRVWAIVVSKALHSHFPLEATSVSVFEDPITEQRTAVLRIECNANATQAVAFWRSLEENFQSFLLTLKGNDRDTFLQKLVLTIHWR